MSGYCSVADVCKAFPPFKREAVGNIADSDIQVWIDGRKARIRSALLSRGVDPDAPAVTGDALVFVRALNLDGAIADLGDSLQNTMTLQPGESSLPGARRKSYETVLKEIMDGVHDSLFQPATAKTAEVRSQFGGIGGGETDLETTPASRSENRIFGMNRRF